MSIRAVVVAALALVVPSAATSTRAATIVAGDLDGDGRASMLDAVMLLRPAPTRFLVSRSQVLLADLDQDGAVGEADVGGEIELILGRGARRLPPTRTLSSPVDGEVDVAVTRETVMTFGRPLQDGFDVTDADVSAELFGVPLPGRLHVSPDRTTVTLFYEEPLPASARVRVTVRGAGLLDVFGVPVDADGDGAPGGDLTIDFDTLSLTVVPGTAVYGRVFASELAPAPEGGSMSVNVPLEGVTITVDGMEGTLRTVTDAMGDFRLEPAPAGRFFVHVDGGSASSGLPAGAYYPFVGKAWESVPGEATSIGEVYLPLVQSGTLQPVSATADTELHFAPSVLEQFPQFADVSITVPADSLYADDGTRGGMVGIAPVPPDRIPGKLPPGLNVPVVITVQTDGATNFDVPVPACFPNLPDPFTGFTLPPGSPSALWSFNHDTGRFEVVGPMTVTDDGTLACTDPGVGTLAPGWHGAQPGSECKDSCGCGPIFGEAAGAPGGGGAAGQAVGRGDLEEPAGSVVAFCPKKNKCGQIIDIAYDASVECCGPMGPVPAMQLKDLYGCPGRTRRPGYDPTANAGLCGPEEVPWISALIPQSKVFYDGEDDEFGYEVSIYSACFAHDTCYNTCVGTRRVGHKAGCDADFANRLRALCDEIPPREVPYEAVEAKRQCRKYTDWMAWAVRRFGGGGYLDGQQEGCICCSGLGQTPAWSPLATTEAAGFSLALGLNACGFR